jgi:hypothetical protein
LHRSNNVAGEAADSKSLESTVQRREVPATEGTDKSPRAESPDEVFGTTPLHAWPGSQRIWADIHGTSKRALVCCQLEALMFSVVTALQ